MVQDIRLKTFRLLRIIFAFTAGKAGTEKGEPIMELRLAKKSDLPQMKSMYRKLIEHMNQNGIAIWDEIYPCEFFENDIENNELYLLAGKNDIAAAFVLCESNDGSAHLEWKSRTGKAMYIDRLGVNVHYLRQGVGGAALKSAIALTKQKGASYLRLFVVDRNKPAINLYEKSGFQRVGGIYEEKIADDFVLREYGFEIEV